jgi:hypothetical protein
MVAGSVALLLLVAGDVAWGLESERLKSLTIMDRSERI